MSDLSNYPRVTLKCKCGNEFDINVIRMKEQKPVLCQICGEEFSAEIGEKFAKAFEDLYKIKYSLEKDGNKFKYSFIYKSTFDQPPAPYPVGDDEEAEKTVHLNLRKI